MSTLRTELFYLLGVYMSDGHISKRKRKNRKAWVYEFSMSSIDRDLLEEVCRNFKRIIGKEPKIGVHIETKRNCKNSWGISIGSKKLLKWMYEITKRKTKIPDIIWQADILRKKAFLRGYMDGDGWIAESHRYNRRTDKLKYQIGFGGISKWIDDLKILFQKSGILVGKRYLVTKGKWIHQPLIRYCIKPKSFIKAEMYFSAKRKQNRVIKYIQQSHTELLRDYMLAISQDIKI